MRPLESPTTIKNQAPCCWQYELILSPVLVTGEAVDGELKILDEIIWQLEGFLSYSLKMNAPKAHEELIGLNLLFSEDMELEAVATEIKCLLAQYCPTLSGLTLETQWSQIGSEDWQDKWKQFWKPERILPNLIICPTWEQLEDTVTSQTDDIVLHLDPGMAFGTGSHGTTRLVLSMMYDYLVGRRVPIKTMMDVGTGSGILALYGAKLGLQQVIGIDNDPIAEEIAIQNVSQNGINIDSSGIVFQTATLESWQANQPDIKTFDLVTANIILQVIIPLLPLLIQTTAPGGLLFLSGILRSQFDNIKAELAQYSSELDFVSMCQHGEWLGLVCRRKETSCA